MTMSVDAEARKEPKSTLQAMDIHSDWQRQFRTSENDRFYNLAFDDIAKAFGNPDEQAVVDGGCGSATKSLHLARRGYRVLGLDFSAAILEHARLEAQGAGLAERMEFRQADLTALELETASANRVLCWGVLMHVPDLPKAVAELSRILKPGGIMVISEGNVRSLQAWFLRNLKKLLGKNLGEVIKTPAGLEFWEPTPTGKLMTRQADIPWLIREFEKHGLKLQQRRAGQFSEIYMILPWKPLRSLVHVFNNIWYRFVRFGGPSYGNLLVFRRPD
jgi:2-polyprenyl-3-methyl-5-hydroxy-6-metoxy-1,4-benzoquinol methylase